MISIKTKREISILREGGKRHFKILNELVAMVVPGISTLELEEYAQKMIKKGGDVAAFLNYKPDGAKRGYPATLCVSINDEIVHGVPNENPKIIKDGDIVSIDLGLVHKGLITDAAVTVGVGIISKIDKKLIEVTRKALLAGIKVAISGNTIGDIGFAIESIARKYGFSIAEGLSGHGVGYKIHEEPYVPNTGKKGGGPILKEGMVIAIEPMFIVGGGAINLATDGFTFKTQDGSRSAHFEHTIAITTKGPLILTDK